MAFLTASDGVRLHYQLEGSGPPLVLHLGAGADSELWRVAGYIEPLARAHTCVLFDHRGHGQSDHPSGAAANDVDRLASDVVELCRHLGHERVAFLGWSNAILVALKVADDHSDLFEKLVLIGGIGRRATPEQVAVASKRRLAEIDQKGWWSILEPMVATEKLPVPQWFLDRVVATDLAPWKGFIEARALSTWSPWDSLPRVRTPTLYLAGELEDPDDLLAEAAAAMPDATRVRIPDREHINAFLYSEFVVPRVLEFLG